jgi:EAL domain-containing protein (putative c-di-GMP-specific phosphodiesterase class I)
VREFQGKIMSAKPHTSASLRTTEIDTSVSQSQIKIRQVGEAIAHNLLRISLQPVVMASDPTRIAFCECLARIQNKDGEILTADTFIDFIEQHDLSRVVDRAITRKAVRYLNDNPKQRISINLSAKNIGDQIWLQILRDACEENPTIGELLIIEITESTFLNLGPKAIDFLYNIRALGCSIAIDDFGAGHTSIRQLGKFRFDFLKIDKSFMADFAENNTSRYLISSMINIAKHFDMVSIVEGVENAADREALCDMGADCLQGYAFGRPELV